MALLISLPAAESYPQSLGMGLWALQRKPLPAWRITSAPKFWAVCGLRIRNEHVVDRSAALRTRTTFRKSSEKEKGGIREEVDAAD